MKARSCSSVLISAALMALVSVPAFADWSVTILGNNAEADGISNGQVVGCNWDNWHAVTWDCKTGNMVDLNPVGCVDSRALGVSNGQQVGYASPDSGSGYATTGYAALWSGTSSSYVSLNPSGWAGSALAGASNGQQVGTAFATSYGYNGHAGLWSGTADSFVDLHPQGYDSSTAIGIGGGHQVGSVNGSATGGGDHAALWSGTAASFVDLNPSGVSSSRANGASDGIQAGYTGDMWTGQYAALWKGSAATYVNLNPAGYLASCAWGVADGLEFGTAAGDQTGYFQHACLWSGTADSFYDLGKLMPDYNTMATGVYKSGNDIWVSGYALDADFMTGPAVLWHYTAPVPEPSSLLALMGGVLGMGGMVFRRRK